MPPLKSRLPYFCSLLAALSAAACVLPSPIYIEPPRQRYPTHPTTVPQPTSPEEPNPSGPPEIPPEIILTPPIPPEIVLTSPAIPPVLRLPRPIHFLPKKIGRAGECGEIEIDGVTIPLDCFQANYGAVAGIPKMPPPVPPQQPVEYLDHRVSNMEGPIRHQRSVGAGAAFALASVMDQGLIRNGGGFLPVSAMHLWARSPQPLLGEMLLANLNKGVAAESTSPYDEQKACSWASAEASTSCKTSKHKAPTTADINSTPFARLISIAEVDGTNGEALRDALLRDQDILYALRVDADVWRTVIQSADAEPLLPEYVGTKAAHTVVLAGFARQDGQWFYLIKNSWGAAWGRNGYAWIQESTLKKNFIASYVIQVSIMNGAIVGPAGPHACPPGQLPDTNSKVCASACPNGAPRKSGAC